MKKTALVLAAATIAISTATATSIANRDPEVNLESLAEIVVAAASCNRALLVRHNMADLVWDVVELQTGEDVNSDAMVDAQAARVDRIAASAATDVHGFCEKIIDQYGPDGRVIRDLVYPR